MPPNGRHLGDAGSSAAPRPSAEFATGAKYKPAVAWKTLRRLCTFAAPTTTSRTGA